ncbi:DNA polymerase IV, partial [Streptomyces sp. YC537]|nr:DNA polymerase IV [Streptomyces boluensis]
YGPGWVQGSGLGRVTVRFETPTSAPGRVRTFRGDDPELSTGEPLPLVDGPEAAPERVPGAGGQDGASGSSEPAIRPKSRSGGALSGGSGGPETSIP